MNIKYMYGTCDRDKYLKPTLSCDSACGCEDDGGSKLKDKNHVTVSSMPDSFVTWTKCVYAETGVKRATLLRQHLLVIPEYQEWLQNRELEE